jgi:hypothetical protein
MEGVDEVHGFVAADRELLTPPVQVDEATRTRLGEVLAAIALGCTPEEVSGFLEDGFPAEVSDLLERPLEADEMGAHVDVLLGVMQSPTLAAAA